MVAARVEGDEAVRVLVAYESVMGNTRSVAESIGTGVRLAVSDAHVQCLHVSRLPVEPPDADLLVLGGPTHFHGLSGEWTRQLRVRGVVEASRRGSPDGYRQLEPGAAGPGVREWLAELEDLQAPATVPGTARLAAAFDTRLARLLAGGASRRIVKGLRRHGYRLIAPPQGFIVVDLAGPLRVGEVDRAQRWGAQLADLALSALRG